MLSWDLHLRLEASWGKQLAISSGRGRGLLGASWGILGLPGLRKQARGSPEASQEQAGGSPGAIRRHPGASRSRHWLRMRQSVLSRIISMVFEACRGPGSRPEGARKQAKKGWRQAGGNPRAIRRQPRAGRCKDRRRKRKSLVFLWSYSVRALESASGPMVFNEIVLPLGTFRGK